MGCSETASWPAHAMGWSLCGLWLFKHMQSFCSSFFLSCKTPFQGIFPKRVEGSLLFKVLATHLQPSAALSNHCFWELKGGGEGKAFLPIFLHSAGLHRKRKGFKQADRGAGGGNPDKPSLVVLQQSSPSLTLWPQGGDVGAGATWDRSAAAWHVTHHALCPCQPRVGQGQLQQATVGVLWMLGHPTAKRHQRQFELGAMESPWGLSWERRGQNANSDKLQLSPFTLSCSHKQSSLNMASMAPLGPRGLGSDVGWPWGTAPQAAVVCKRL